MKSTKLFSLRLFPLLILLLCAAWGGNKSVRAQNFVSPEVATYLPSDLNENSGLLNLDGEIWTHNDSGGEPELYQADPATGTIIRTVAVVNAQNEDWEDITWDDTFIYIGDFGNNEGNRTDLRIYRVPRSELNASDEVTAESIEFYYSDQTSFDPNYHYTNFDCEAMIHWGDQLYLFTKNWIDSKTNCYALPDSPGTYEAVLLAGFDTECLVTGATVMPGNDEIVLIGYNQNGGSFTWLFRDYPGDAFFEGSSTKLVWTLLSQIEGVCHHTETSIYISSEEFAGLLEPTLFQLDLSGFLMGVDPNQQNRLLLYTNRQTLYYQQSGEPHKKGTIAVYDLGGQLVQSISTGPAPSGQLSLEMCRGVYMAVWEAGESRVQQKIFLQP